MPYLDNKSMSLGEIIVRLRLNYDAINSPSFVIFLSSHAAWWIIPRKYPDIITNIAIYRNILGRKQAHRAMH